MKGIASGELKSIASGELSKLGGTNTEKTVGLLQGLLNGKKKQ
jgi:hypothetical protein